ncbi:unnamed protein product [Diatraea saccharalis]|uniref:Uncharacterized protein n=1 Tax=Diatraea saccharalis TaxID=40085 RepID=A0A9N9R053_9NEOP|nr:unnamed protein product [Diatraea saccharalis]
MSTYPPSVDEDITSINKVKKAVCPEVSKKCVTKQNDSSKTKVIPRRFYIEGRTKKDITENKSFRSRYSDSDEISYLESLKDVIPIPNRLAEQVISEIHNDKKHYYLLSRDTVNKNWLK